MMVLKKNGQERNKLHLTLSLGGSDASRGHNMEALHVPMSSRTATAMPMVPAEPMDESYMIMNSANLVLSNIKNVGCTPQSNLSESDA